MEKKKRNLQTYEHAPAPAPAPATATAEPTPARQFIQKLKLVKKWNTNNIAISHEELRLNETNKVEEKT